MKKIIVPIDFSEESISALNIALNIATQNHQEIILIHVIELPTHLIENGVFSTYGTLYEQTFNEIKVQKEKELNNLIAQYFPRKISQHVDIGHITEYITQYTDKNEIDLLVMGTKGCSGIDELVLGSNAERIVRYSKCPVITTQKNFGDFSPKQVVFASHFEQKNFEETSPFIDFMSLYPNATIHLVRINTPNNFMNTIHAEKLMNNFVNFWNIKNYTISQFDYESFEHGLFFFQKRMNTDLIVLATHKRTGISQLFTGSQTEHIVNQFETPIFSFKI